MMFPVVAYAPTAATKPSIAAQPLNLSASGVMINLLFVNKYNTTIKYCKEKGSFE